MGRRRRQHRLQVACGAALAYKSTARDVRDALGIHEHIKQARQAAELPMHFADLELPAVTEAGGPSTEAAATEAADTAPAATEATEATAEATRAATLASTSTSSPSPCPDDFVEAIKKGNVKLVKDLLSEKQAVDLKTCTVPVGANTDGLTGVALHLAAWEGQADIVQALLDHHADATTPTTAPTVAGSVRNWPLSPGSTPLMLASAASKLEVVEKLTTTLGNLVNQQNEGGCSALIVAVARGSIEVVKVLLGSPYIEVNLQDKLGRSALIVAAQYRMVEVFNELLERNDLDINLQKQDGGTVLTEALNNNLAEAAEALLERKDLNINVQTKENQYSALMSAARQGQVEVVNALLGDKRLDVKVNLQDKDGQSALIWALRQVTSMDAQVEVVERLLRDSTIDVNMKDQDGVTALMVAISVNSQKAFELLFKNSNASVEDKDGATALVYAGDMSADLFPWVTHFARDVVQDADALWSRFRPGFLSAARSGHRKALRFFMTYRTSHCSPNIDDFGDCYLESRAMVEAAKGGQIEIAEWLFRVNKSGTRAGLHCYDEENYTALKGGVRHGHYAITNTLLQHEASVTEDIDETDDEAKASATWLGVEYSVVELIRPFVANETGPWAKNVFTTPPANCEGDMKDRCSGVLLGHAQSAEMLHLLWSWQTSVDCNDEVWSENRRMALVANLQRLGGEAAALALLSRGVSLTEEQIEQASDSNSTWQWPLGPDEETDKTLHRVKTWNRLHWCALSCDTVALTSAYRDGGSNNDILKLLDKEEGQDWTPKEVAEANKERCAGVYEVLQSLEDLRDSLRLQGNFYVLSATTAALVTIGIYANRLLFLQHQSFQKHGWCFMLAIPTTLTCIGCGIAYLYYHYGGRVETVPKAMTILGIVVAAAGVLLALATSIVFKSEGAAAYLREIKKKGNRKLDRCWEKLECGISWCLFGVVFIQGLMVKGKRLALFAGFVNAVASTLPLVMASPRPWAISLRLLPGTCVVAWWVYTLRTSESTDELEPLSAETLLISTMCLAVAWGDARGACAAAVGAVARIVEIEMVQKKGADKFTAGKLIFGRAEIAAHGIEHALGLTSEDISAGLKDPIEAMRQEIETSGDKNDRENFKYIVEGTSGNPADYPSAVAESLETGRYHGGKIGKNDFDTGHQGRTLSDWMEEKEVRLASLSQAEFIAVRFYTSSSFPKINGPLRKKAQAIADDDHEEKAKRHPWAMVVYLMDRGIKKLRSVQAQVDPDAFARQTTLWRGMRDMEADIVKFKRHGGTEMAPMSTTTNEDVARQYAASKVPLVFKYVVGGMKTGVCIRFLSLYPKEEEFLYAPLTYLTLKNQYEDDGTTVLVVEPVMS